MGTYTANAFQSLHHVGWHSILHLQQSALPARSVRNKPPTTSSTSHTLHPATTELAQLGIELYGSQFKLEAMHNVLQLLHGLDIGTPSPLDMLANEVDFNQHPLFTRAFRMAISCYVAKYRTVFRT